MNGVLVTEMDLPIVTPSAGPVDDGAVALRSSTAQVHRSATDAHRSWSGLAEVLSSPGATDALPSALADAATTTGSLAAAGGAVASALCAFAEELSAIRRARRTLLADVEELRSRVHGDDAPAEYLAVNDDLHARARRLRARWQSAQDELSAVLRVQTGRDGIVLPGIHTSTPAAPYAVLDFAAAAADFSDAGRLPLLRVLARQGPAALERWLVDRPEDAARLLERPPDPDSVRSWWAVLGDDERAALVTGLACVTGNLDGVRYADRARANRHTLDTELPTARARYRSLSGRVGRHEALSGTERAEYARLAERVAALEALERTLAAGTTDAPRTLVSLLLGSPPLAAVGIGDLDAAGTVTVTVPGMGNTVAGSMEAWTAGADNLLRAQRSAAHRSGGDPDVATIAWMGYDTPQLPPSPEVLASGKAEVGARALRRLLAGVSATRSWDGGSNLSVVAHSYGTTTATLAVAEAPVANLTLLASAGIDPRVPDVRAVAVPSGHVWASQATTDIVANLGRGVVEVPRPGIGTDQPINTGNPLTATRSAAIVFRSAHPVNPGDATWGARTFSSDDETIDGRTYEGSDGHGATPASEAELRGENPTVLGYLDADTSSLRNTAMTSLGLTPGGTRIP